MRGLKVKRAGSVGVKQVDMSDWVECPALTFPLAGGSDVDQRFASVPSAGEGALTGLTARLSQRESEANFTEVFVSTCLAE